MILFIIVYALNGKYKLEYLVSRDAYGSRSPWLSRAESLPCHGIHCHFKSALLDRKGNCSLI